MQRTLGKIHFGLSQKSDGQMRVAINGDNSVSQKNRTKFFRKMGANPKRVVACDLVHGKNIYQAAAGDAGRIIIATDGLITRDRNLILTVTAADCLPLYFFDQKTGAIGIAHAGWRGVWQNLAAAMVREIKKTYQARPKDLQVFIGAHIGSCHFSLSPNLAQEFKLYKKFLKKSHKAVMVDLGGIVKQQLVESGVLAANIEADPNCTYCEEKYFSNRRDRPKVVEAMVAYVWRK